MNEPKKITKMKKQGNNSRDFSCELTGKILSKDKRKVYDKDSAFYGNDYFRLKITSEVENKEETLFIYSNLVSKQIFQTVEQNHYIDKRYLFFCERKKRGLVLNNWRELTHNLNHFTSNKETILKTHK